MKVRNEIAIYEPESFKNSIVIVENHNIYDDRVWITINDTKVCVIARDLRRAIENATNHKGY